MELKRILAEKAKSFPYKNIIVDENGKYTYSEFYLELEENLNYLKKHLSSSDLVLLRLPRNKDYVLSMIALTILRVPFISVDVNQPAGRIDKIISIAKPSKELVKGKGRIKVNELCDSSFTEHNVWAIYFTSGSTGDPKGVKLSFKVVENTYNWQSKSYELTENDNIGGYTPYSFVISYMDIFLSLLSGATLYIIPDKIRNDLKKLEEYINCQKITIMHITTPVGEMLIRKLNVPSLRCLILAGQQFPSIDLTKVKYKIFNMYGNTECGGVTLCEMHGQPASCIGMPVNHMNIFIVDKKLHNLKNEEYGELFVTGPQVAMGYLAENNKFRNVTINGRKVYGFLTGDYGKKTEKGIIFDGRRDQQHKINGIRFDLSEVYSNILKICPKIEQLHLLVKDNQIYGWYISPEAIDRNHLAKTLENFVNRVAIPKKFIRVSNFPLNSNGKIDNKALLKNINEKASSSLEGGYEKRLSKLWKNVLGRDVQISKNSDFISLGATSLQIMELGIEVLNEFGKKVNFVELYNNPIFKDMLNVIKNKKFSPIYTFQKNEKDNPPLFVVHSGNTGSDVYRPLFDKVKSDFSIYVIEPHNLLNPDNQIRGITNLAKYYLNMIKKFIPGIKHINLMGWSYGGVVASEMSKLQDDDLIIDHLYVIDSPFYLDDDDMKELDLKEKSGFYTRYFQNTHIFKGINKKNVTTELLIRNNHKVFEDLYEYDAGRVNTPTTFVRSLVEKNPLSEEKINKIFTNVNIVDVFEKHDYLFVKRDSREAIQKCLGLRYD